MLPLLALILLMALAEISPGYALYTSNCLSRESKEQHKTYFLVNQPVEMVSSRNKTNWTCLLLVRRYGTRFWYGISSTTLPNNMFWCHSIYEKVYGKVA